MLAAVAAARRLAAHHATRPAPGTGHCETNGATGKGHTKGNAKDTTKGYYTERDTKEHYRQGLHKDVEPTRAARRVAEATPLDQRLLAYVRHNDGQHTGTGGRRPADNPVSWGLSKEQGAWALAAARGEDLSLIHI